MATENHAWDTSTAHIRRTLWGCIERGRRAGGREGAELWEAYRLLGTALHTLEDLLAHSNWCEIALRKMGHTQVFCHVGDRGKAVRGSSERFILTAGLVVINTPNGPAPPLVTGTFGGADFLHSLMGEATDHLSQASVTDLSQKIEDVCLRVIPTPLLLDFTPGLKRRSSIRDFDAQRHTVQSLEGWGWRALTNGPRRGIAGGVKSLSIQSKKRRACRSPAETLVIAEMA
jgi:Heterokaryon incompatibility protein Het-C